MRRVVLVASAALVVSLSTSCSDPDPATQVLVSFEADRAVREVARDIEIVVWGGMRGDPIPSDDEQMLRFALEDIRRPPARGEEIWPVTHTLVPLEEDATRLFRIEGRLYDRTTPEPIATVRAISGYVEGRSLVLRLRFYSQCLYVDPCESPDFSCNSEGDCQPSRFNPEGLPDLPDDGVADGGVEPACRTALDCDDGVGCTDDVCFRGECLHEPRNDLCTQSTDAPRCDPTNGCQYGTGCSTTGADANCQAFDCEIARCEDDVCVRTALCSAGQTCCGGECVSCNDGDACTIDGCDASAGACANVGGAGAPCDDGQFCTGMGTCAADGSCDLGGDPCGAGLTCSEPDRACVGCVDDSQCDDVQVVGTCRSLEGGTPSQICMGAGLRTVTTTPHVCRAGSCVAQASTRTDQSCTLSGSTDTLTCDTSEVSWSTVCDAAPGGLCATTGLQQGTLRRWECRAGRCERGAPTTSTRTCTRTPDPSCFDSGVPDSGSSDTGTFDSSLDTGTDTFDSGTFDSSLDTGTDTFDSGTFDTSLDTGTDTFDSGTFDTGTDTFDTGSFDSSVETSTGPETGPMPASGVGCGTTYSGSDWERNCMDVPAECLSTCGAYTIDCTTGSCRCTGPGLGTGRTCARPIATTALCLNCQRAVEDGCCVP